MQEAKLRGESVTEPGRQEFLPVSGELVSICRHPLAENAVLSGTSLDCLSRSIARISDEAHRPYGTNTNLIISVLRHFLKVFGGKKARHFDCRKGFGTAATKGVIAFDTSACVTYGIRKFGAINPCGQGAAFSSPRASSSPAEVSACLRQKSLIQPSNAGSVRRAASLSSQ